MVGFLLRVIYQLSALSPIAFGVLCCGKNSSEEIVNGLVISLIIVSGFMMALLVVLNIIRTSFSSKIPNDEIVSVKRNRGAFPCFLAAYVFPFLLSGSSVYIAVAFAAILIVSLSLRKGALAYNPLADLLGFYSYELVISNAQGKCLEIFVISDESPLELLEGGSSIAMLDVDFYVMYRTRAC